MSEPEPSGRRFGPGAIAYVLALVAAIGVSAAFGANTEKGFALFDGSVPLEYVFFVLTLLGVALFHHHSLYVALGGLAAVAIYLLLRSYLSTAEGPPILRHIKTPRIFDRVLVAVSWQFARRLEEWLGTRHLQTQLRLLLYVALLVGLVPIMSRGMGNCWASSLRDGNRPRKSRAG